MSDPFLRSTGAPEVPPEPHKPAAAPVANTPTIEVLPEPKPEPPAPTARCHHCGRRIRRGRHRVTTADRSFDFHDDRRACRRAAHEVCNWLGVSPPERADQVSADVYGAALIGFDYVTLPWWLRWVPDRWLDGLRRDVAVQVGGIVERRCRMKASGREDGDD